MSVDCLHTRVAAQAGRTPDATALTMGADVLTYGALEQASNRVARLLLDAGLRSGDRVCLFVPKCTDAIVAMLAVLKAGGIYVPVDLDSPAQRVTHVIDKAQPALIIAHPKARPLLSKIAELFVLPPIVGTEGTGFEDTGLNCVGEFASASGCDDGPLNIDIDSTQAAHILFTSGSTGRPKGVVITHANVTGFLDWACPHFNIAAGDKLSGHPPLHFDLSTFDIYGALSCGAELHMVPPEVNLLAPKLAEFIRARALDQWFSVPSMLTYMANFDVVSPGDFPDLKRLLWCGEAIPTATLIYWMERLPHVEFTNLYGPTEATIASSYHTMTACPGSKMDAIPIGRACAGEALLVLDEAMAPVADGEIGELYIGGTGLSPGYWQDDEKTAAAFRTMSGADGAEARIYRTGDLGRRAPNGTFHYLGRTDSQIKSRGYRIELGEIETAATAQDVLQEAAIVGVEVGGFEGTAICCAYVAKEGHDVTPQSLRKALSTHIPRYMLPAQWLEMASLPKNANGKIDRPALRTMFSERQAEPVNA